MLLNNAHCFAKMIAAKPDNQFHKPASPNSPAISYTTTRAVVMLVDYERE